MIDPALSCKPLTVKESSSPPVNGPLTVISYFSLSINLYSNLYGSACEELKLTDPATTGSEIFKLNSRSPKTVLTAVQFSSAETMYGEMMSINTPLDELVSETRPLASVPITLKK